MSSYNSSSNKSKYGNNKSSSSSTSNRKPYDRKPFPSSTNSNSLGSSRPSNFPRGEPPTPFSFESSATTLQGKKFISLNPTAGPSKLKGEGANRPASGGVGNGGGTRKIQTDLGEGMELFQRGIKDTSGRVNEFKSADDACPVCLTQRISKPNLRLLISPCYHKLCDSCVDKVFSLASSECPSVGCTRMLRKTQFHHQTFEDLVVEQEVSVRRRMGTIFNKTRGDFDDDRGYNDYLEQVEDWTYNILNNVDRAETEYKIQEWQQANASAIATNAVKRESEAAQEREEAAEEQAEKARRAQMALEQDVEAERLIGQYKKEQLEDVARGGDGSAAQKKLQALRVSMGEVPDDALARPIRKIASKNKTHAPTSPRYDGPYVPLPWTHPETMIQSEFGGSDWSAIPASGKVVLEDKQGAQSSLKMHGDAGRVRAGGFRMEQVWKRDLAMVQDSLLVGLC